MIRTNAMRCCAVVLGWALMPGMASAGWHATGKGACNFEALPGVELLEGVGTSQPMLFGSVRSTEGDFKLGIAAYPAQHAKEGPLELTSVSLAFGGSELLATDVVTVDGTLIPVEPKASDDTGLWRPSMEMRLRDAVRTGRRLAVELVRNGKTELRSIDLAPLQAALAAVEASRWRCN